MKSGSENFLVIRWLKVAGPLAEDLGYGGPAVYAPAVMPEEGEEGYFSSLDLLRGLTLCWRDAPPHGKAAMPEDLRERMLDSLAASCGLSRREAVRAACDFFFRQRGMHEAGMRAAINGLNICGDDPAYRAAFILMAADHGRHLKPETARDAAQHIVLAVKGLDLEELLSLDRETILAACTAAYAALDDRAALAEFHRERLASRKFSSPALAEAVSDLAVNPGIEFAPAFARLHAALQKLGSSELGGGPRPRRKPADGEPG